MNLATKFKELRIASNLTLAELGKKAGYEKTTIWKIESGFSPRMATLHAAATKGLGLKPSEENYKSLISLWTGSKVAPDPLAVEIKKVKSAESSEFDQLSQLWDSLRPTQKVTLLRLAQAPHLLDSVAALLPSV